MSRVIKDMRVVTNRECTEIERQRLLKVKDERPEWWSNNKLSSWARNMFGETLTEKTPESQIACSVCGRLPVDPDENLLYLDFSFCDEYNCSMHICEKCLNKMKEKIKENRDATT